MKLFLAVLAVLTVLLGSAAAVVVSKQHTALPIQTEPHQLALNDDPMQFSVALFLTATNNERVKAGVATLKENAALDATAQAHAEDMKARGYYNHTTPEGVTGYQRIDKAVNVIGGNRGENQDNMCVFSTVADEIKRVNDSPGHRQNEIDPAYNSLGLGYVASDTGPCNGYWVMDFAQL